MDSTLLISNFGTVDVINYKAMTDLINTGNPCAQHSETNRFLETQLIPSLDVSNYKVLTFRKEKATLDFLTQNTVCDIITITSHIGCLSCGRSNRN